MTTQPQRARWRTALVSLGLLGIIWIVFGQTLGHAFVNFDDDKYVYDNPQIRAGLHWSSVLWLFGHSHAALWHPLTSITHMIDCQMYGLHPAGHHFTNVFLHTIAVVLLLLVLHELTGNFWASAFVAALFAIHPMRVESVAWVAERKDVLSAVFLMLTIGAYGRYARQPGISRYGIVILFVAGGLMSKATFVTVPLVLLLLDYWPLERLTNVASSRRALLEKITLLGLGAIASVATWRAQSVTMSSLDQLPMLPRIKNAAVSVVIYIRQMFWPRDLAVFYPHPHDHLRWSIVLASVLAIAAITVGAVFVRRKYPYVAVGWLWYLGMLVPVLGLVQVGLQSHADRFTYLPHVGLFILISWGIADLTRRWPHRTVILSGGAAIVLTFLTVCSYRQTMYWQDSVTLWTHALAVTSNNAMAHQDLAVALWEQGKFQESKEHAQASNIIHWQTVLKDFPDDSAAHDALGTALVQRGDVREALGHWQASLEIDPADGNAANNLAWVMATWPDPAIRDGRQAVGFAERAAGLPGGDNPMVLRTLAAAYAESGQFAKAAENAGRAAEMAIAQQNAALAETLRNEMNSYTANQPHRETPPQ